MTSSYASPAIQRRAAPVPTGGTLVLFSLLSACSTAANSVANSPVDSPDVIPSTNSINRTDDSIGSSVQLNDLLGKEVNGENVTVTTEGVVVVIQADNRYYLDTSELAAGEHRVVLVEETASGGTITHHIDIVIDPAPRWATPETEWTITRGEDFSIVLPDAKDNGTVGYEVVDLPDGWAFDEDTRILSGVYEGEATALSVAYVADDGYSKVVRAIDLKIATPEIETPAPERNIDAKAGEHWEIVYAFNDDVNVRLRDQIISPLQLVDANGEVVYDKGGVYDAEQNAIVWRLGFADAATYNVQVAPDNGIYDTTPGQLSVARVTNEAALVAVGSSVVGQLADEDEVDSYVAYLEADTDYYIDFTGAVLDAHRLDVITPGVTNVLETVIPSRFEGLSPNLYWEQDLSLFSVKNSAGEAVADTASDRISLGHLQAETTAAGTVQYRVGEDAPDYATPFADLGTTVRVDEAGYYTIDVGGGTGDYALSVHEDVDYSYTPAERSSQEGKGANIDPEDLDLIDFHILSSFFASPSGSTNFFNSDTGSTWFYEGKENEPTTYLESYVGLWAPPLANRQMITGPVLYPVTSGSYYGDDFDNLDGNLRFRLEVFEHDGHSIDSLALLFSPKLIHASIGAWVPPDWSKQFFSSLSLEDAKHGDGSVVWEFDFDVKSALSAVSDHPLHLNEYITGFDFSFSRVSDDIDLAYSFEFFGVTDAQDEPAPSGIISEFDHYTSNFY